MNGTAPTNDTTSPHGPLAGLRVVEFVSIGPGPHCAMMLADMGAEVLRIDRAGGNGWENPVVDRGRGATTVDIRTDEGRARCLELLADADVLIEGYRPGVMERLGLGPEVALKINPRLVYGRVTGWGQTGPLAKVAGHDINYIALTGALAAIGKPGQTATPPLNLVGDFGGGSMLLAFGIMAALWEREKSGRGQVVDAAIVDGVSSQMSMFAGLVPSGRISMKRDENMLAGAAPYYRCYACSDGKEISIGAIEPHFYAQLVEKIGAPADLLSRQTDQKHWKEDGKILAEIFASRSADEWTLLLEGSDCCFAPIVELDDAQSHPHLQQRGVYACVDGVNQVAPVPRFSRTPGAIQPSRSGEDMAHRWARSRRAKT